MQCTILKGKLHRARVTHAVVDYEGSCAIDSELMELAGILDHEQIAIYNVDNGKRFTTYAIRAEKGSKIISVNGAAAHRASPGDKVIICAYVGMTEAEAKQHHPSLVYLGEGNEIIDTKNVIPVQVA